MKWFKHDSNANSDAKLKKVRIKYGMTGYGLYWYCLELIAGSVDVNNITFELEHDAEIIAHDTGINVQLINEMMAYMTDLGLFENNQGAITCLKMATRLDQSMTSNPTMRKIIDGLKSKNHDCIKTESTNEHDAVMQDKTRLELDKTKHIKPVKQAISVPYVEIINLYNEHLPQLRRCVKATDSIKAKIKASWLDDKRHQSLEFWKAYFSALPRLQGRINWWNGTDNGGKKCGIDVICRKDIVQRSVEEIIDARIWG